MHPLNLYYVTMTTYDATFRNVKSVYTSDDLRETLGEILANNGKTQIRIAETEKYPHVTFFFSGGRESQFEGEKRIMIPSPKVATYDLMPEMSAYGLTEAILPELKNKTADFICLNLANADMVGHTGVYNSIIKAVETVDTCVARIAEEALKNDYTLIITADHGNSDYVINDDGSPNTAHTTNVVPVFLVDNYYHPEITNGKLADLAPTILELMGLPKSKFMDGKSLIK
jgi:2,3-bisphosphoglycerate-independent phosphoglycerate mutase